MDWKWTMNMSVGVTMLRGDCVWPGGGGGGVTTIINTLTAQLGSARRNEEGTLVAAVVQQTAPPIITIMLLSMGPGHRNTFPVCFSCKSKICVLSKHL